MAEATAEHRLRGLSGAEVAERKRRGETNAVRVESSRSYRRIILDNTANPVNLVLFTISIMLVILGLTGDAIFTGGLVLANVLVGIFQEGRAKRQLDQIALLTRPEATVIRDGAEQTVPPEEIVKDDIVRIRAGDQVLADGAVLTAESLSVDESLLTGESDSVLKKPGERLHSGSFAMTGSGVMEVQGVGAQRLAQRITEQARSFKKVKTPLQREVTVIIWVAAAIVALLSLEVIDTFRDLYGGIPLVEGVRAAAVIVALVPQGLWFMITVTYAMAIVRMARTGALVQRLNAVESISHVDVLCLDKTGTLTTNSLKLETLAPVGVSVEELRVFLGRFAASASFSNRTNDAILEAFPHAEAPVTQEVVFDSRRKWSALVFEDGAEAYVLGAPEVLAPKLGAELPEIEQWTRDGLRVLVFARSGPARVHFDDEDAVLPDGLTPLGVIVLRDLLRPEAAETIAQFREAGIGLKLISGDHPETVSALATQVGFDPGVRAVSGIELAAMAPEQWPVALDKANVFGRVTPEQKEQLVRAFQRQGRYVAMIGDGVNDVPSLKAAEVAVSLRSASPVTRSVADIVLLNDSFAVLPPAFIEGRRIRNGMVGIIRLFLVRILSVMLVILGAGLLQEEFPVTPRHTALIAALTVGLPALGLAAWAQPGRTPRYLLPIVLEFTLPAALLLGIGGLGVYWSYLTLDASVETARTALTAFAVLAGITLIPYAPHPPEGWLDHDVLYAHLRSVALAAAMLVLAVAAFLWAPARRIYELEALSALDFAVVLLMVALWAIALRLVWSNGRAAKLRALLQRLRRRGDIRA